MNHFHASRQPMQAQSPNTATGSTEARKLAEGLMDAMSALLGLIERETELVRAGKVREAMTLESKKQELSRNYVGAVSQLKANQAQLAKSAPELLSTLHRHHDAFRAMLQVNLTVLATAHAVSESVVRGVNAEIQKRNVPNTYTAAGRRAAAGSAPHHPACGQPLALSAQEQATLLRNIARRQRRAVSHVSLPGLQTWCSMVALLEGLGFDSSKATRRLP
ncbi:hypothetical protein ABIA43_000054 [Bradyrhizobium sp. USDA 328]